VFFPPKPETRRLVEEALSLHGQRETARLLGISPRALSTFLAGRLENQVDAVFISVCIKMGNLTRAAEPTAQQTLRDLERRRRGRGGRRKSA